MMKKIPSWVILVVVAIVLGFLVYRTSGYLSPASIQTDLGDSSPSLFSLGTKQSCIAGNTAVGQDGSAESIYTKQDGTGYGICGAEQLVKDEMNYRILSDETPLGD